ncbi:IclR family transcriptional regulator C-terminal domain-containing protein [Streptomyces sp. NPDC008092]|uniref:IclR family transcriptional regulator n=1 Tax=Streptomyces sp. NPDC008092 TaxID=3364808 RepID=UPI0036ED5D5A
MSHPTPARSRGRKPAHGEPVLDRALRLLTVFEGHDGPLSLTLLSTRAGLPKSTTLRIARQLVAWGALERTGDGEFVIGLRLLQLATLAPRGHGLRSIAMPFMEDLHKATGQHVLFAVRDGEHAVLVERLSAHRAGRVDFRVGGRMPLHSTGIGLVLLAHAPAEVQEAVLGADLVAEDSGRRVDPAELRRTLAQVRQEGTAVKIRGVPEPMASVAAPILDARQHVIAALAVIAPAQSMQPPAMKPAVVAVARAISRAVRSSDIALGPGSDGQDS